MIILLRVSYKIRVAHIFPFLVVLLPLWLSYSLSLHCSLFRFVLYSLFTKYLWQQLHELMLAASHRDELSEEFTLSLKQPCPLKIQEPEEFYELFN